MREDYLILRRVQLLSFVNLIHYSYWKRVRHDPSLLNGAGSMQSRSRAMKA